MKKETISNMHQIIKDFLLTYTEPQVKFSGISADELASMLEKEINKAS